MAVQEQPTRPEEAKRRFRIPPPILEAFIYHESLGRWIDNLMGDGRIQRKVDKELSAKYGWDDPELWKDLDAVE